MCSTIIIFEYVTPRVKRPAEVRMLIETPRWMPRTTNIDKQKALFKVLGPLSRTVMTYTAQIDHYDQIYCPTGQEANGYARA